MQESAFALLASKRGSPSSCECLVQTVSRYILFFSWSAWIWNEPLYADPLYAEAPLIVQCPFNACVDCFDRQLSGPDVCLVTMPVQQPILIKTHAFMVDSGFQGLQSNALISNSVNQCWEPTTFGMPPWHLSPDVEKSKSKETLQSQSPIAAFKACNAFKRWALPTARLCCPVLTPRVNPRIGPTARLPGTIHIHGNMQQSTQINCVELHVQVLFYARNVLYWYESISRKNANRPKCAFADSASTVLCGAVIRLTPCIAPTVERECDLHKYAEFKDAEDMIQKLNEILSKPIGSHRLCAEVSHLC